MTTKQYDRENGITESMRGFMNIQKMAGIEACNDLINILIDADKEETEVVMIVKIHSFIDLMYTLDIIPVPMEDHTQFDSEVLGALQEISQFKADNRIYKALTRWASLRRYLQDYGKEE